MNWTTVVLIIFFTGVALGLIRMWYIAKLIDEIGDKVRPGSNSNQRHPWDSSSM